MANENFDQLKVDVGLTQIKECNNEENAKFSEMEKNGEPLPNDIRRLEYVDAKMSPCYGRLQSKTDPEQEKLYVLMRISKDLHFIKVLFQVLLVLGILGFVIALIVGSLG